MKLGEPIIEVKGSGVVLRGNDIDTDQIIPARYMKVVTFDGLGEFAFGDLRAEAKEKGEIHPLDNPSYAGATFLLSNKNFGCGSSREHAPQSLMRWGIGAVVAESFAEIFAGNCTSLGIPTVILSAEVIEEVMNRVEKEPKTEILLDLEGLTLKVGETQHSVAMSETYRNALRMGKWDSTTILLEQIDAVEAKGAELPYMSNFAAT